MSHPQGGTIQSHEPSRLSPVFSFGSADSPADLLNNAAAVCRFLQDVAPALVDDGRLAGLSEIGALGLVLILDGVESTINEAVKRL